MNTDENYQSCNTIQMHKMSIHQEREYNLQPAIQKRVLFVEIRLGVFEGTVCEVHGVVAQ